MDQQEQNNLINVTVEELKTQALHLQNSIKEFLEYVEKIPNTAPENLCAFLEDAIYLDSQYQVYKTLHQVLGPEVIGRAIGKKYFFIQPYRKDHLGFFSINQKEYGKAKLKLALVLSTDLYEMETEEQSDWIAMGVSVYYDQTTHSHVHGRHELWAGKEYAEKQAAVWQAITEP